MGEILRRSEALADGYTDNDIRQLYRRGGWQRLGHGCYVAGADRSAVDGHRLLLASTLPTMASDALVSHESAAVLYDLPTWNLRLDQAHVTRDRRNGGRIRSELKVHCAPVHGSVAAVDGYLVTAPPRTIVDLARTLPFEQAVVIGDAAMRTFGVRPSDLAIELELAKYRRGISNARRVVAFLDPHSESVGESRSRVMFRRDGLPMPLGQVDIYDSAGRFLGRADFYWEKEGVIGEFDGKVKYGKLAQPGQSAADVVFHEKRREDSLRAPGHQFARWVWDELPTDGPPDRIRTALALGRATPKPTGHTHQAPLPPPRPLALRPIPEQPHTP